MGLNKSRNKGVRFELEVVHRAQAKGLTAKRIPLSGECEGFKGDVVVEGRVLECKKRAEGFKKIYQWLAPEYIDALVIGGDREEPLIVCRLESWLNMLML